MSALVIRWQGPTRRNAIRAVLQICVQAWLQEWAVDSARGAVEAEVEELPRERIQATSWQLVNAPDGSCVLAGLDATAIARLGGVLAAAPVRLAADFRTALAVGRDAVEALLRAMVADSGEMSETEEIPAAVRSDRHGWTCFEVCLGDIAFMLLIDPILCDRLHPRPSRLATLERRTTALAQTDIGLCATLELGSVDISLVSSLRPGDILGTNVALSAPLTLGAIGGHAVLAGRLTALDRHKAILVDQLH